jgi:hypothetical protein
MLAEYEVQLVVEAQAEMRCEAAADAEARAMHKATHTGVSLIARLSSLFRAHPLQERTCAQTGLRIQGQPSR